MKRVFTINVTDLICGVVNTVKKKLSHIVEEISDIVYT